MFCEIIAGYYSNSVAIMTDAAHMCSDVLGFAVSICSVFISMRKPNPSHSYGYHRAEVLGAMCSVVIIWIMIIVLCVEATIRLMNPDNIVVDAEIMLVASCLSLGCNIFNLLALHDLPCCKSKKEEENEDAIQMGNGEDHPLKS